MMPSKRMVVAADTQGVLHAIGPVYNDATIDKIIDEIEDAGWTVCGSTALVCSLSGLRAELKQARAGGED